MSVHSRKYGVEAVVEFPLVEFGATDFEATPVAFVAGDTTTIKDGASDGNSDNAPAHITKGLYKITIAAGEMEAARVQILIIDQTSPKAWEDQAITIETYGHASAQHAIDLDTALADATIGTCTTNTDMVGTTGASTHTAANVKTAIEVAGSHLALIKTVTDNLPDSGALTTIGNELTRALGLVQENQYIDTYTFDSQGRVTGFRLRTYSVAGSVGGASNVLATYTGTVTYAASGIASYSMVKV